MTPSPSGPIRVLVVEESARLRSRFVDSLNTDPAIEVVGQAGDGQSAIDLCLQLRPDVITMDVVLPGVSGLVATKQLMQRCPTPILIISAATDRSEQVNAYTALAAGAVDVLDKPRAGVLDDAAWDRLLVATVKMVSRIQVITHLSRYAGPVVRDVPPPPSPTPPSRPSAATEAGPPPAPDGTFSVVGLGASTGGPAAVATVLSTLPQSFILPVLLVLHVSDTFGPEIASWLKTVTGRPVRLAHHGEPIAGMTGQVVMAPPGQHLVVRSGHTCLNREPERYSCRPSVDVLFESLAAEAGAGVAACLLTGMGKDGASGLLQVRRQGGFTIAQDEASSVVFGMPGEAVRLGAAQQVLPVGQIGPLLGRLAVATGGHR